MNNEFTNRDFEDLKVYLDFAREYIEEYILYSDNEINALYDRLNEIETILSKYIDKQPNIEESPE